MVTIACFHLSFIFKRCGWSYYLLDINIQFIPGFKFFYNRCIICTCSLFLMNQENFVHWTLLFLSWGLENKVPIGNLSGGKKQQHSIRIDLLTCYHTKLICASQCRVREQGSLQNIFSKKIKCWGEASPGAIIVITLGWYDRAPV